MAIMWINLIMTYSFSLFSRYFSSPFKRPFSSPAKTNKLFLYLTILTFILVAGLRNNIGDTYFYIHSYIQDNFSLNNIDFSDDFGFNIMQYYLEKISKNPQILILVTALITNLLIVKILSNYSRLLEISIYIYITSGMFTTSMNGIRQYLAAAIVFSATKFLFEGNFWKYALIVLFASTFHKTALVLLPIYFIVRRKAWTKVTLILLMVAVIIVILFNQFTGVLFSALQDTQYGHYNDFSEGGANKMRIAVTAVPIVIAYLGRDKLRSLWPQSDYIVNLSIISAVFIIIASKNWIFARFNIYFDLYHLILISWIIELFRKKDRKLVYFLIIFFYFIYFYYEEVIGYGLIYKSNFFNI